MNTIDYLKQAKVKLGIESDYALAARLGVTRGAISNMQRGRNSMGDDTAIKVADILEVPRGLVLLDIAIERSSNARNPEVAAAWTRLAEKFSNSFEVLMSKHAPGAAPLGPSRENGDCLRVSAR
jgi:transcriptional regulator with XRE-family HTH domain